MDGADQLLVASSGNTRPVLGALYLFHRSFATPRTAFVFRRCDKCRALTNCSIKCERSKLKLSRPHTNIRRTSSNEKQKLRGEFSRSQGPTARLIKKHVISVISHDTSVCITSTVKIVACGRPLGIACATQPQQQQQPLIISHQKADDDEKKGREVCLFVGGGPHSLVALRI
ncbi:hypothetical protein ACLOJK_001979 [Asimina triloba]